MNTERCNVVKRDTLILLKQKVTNDSIGNQIVTETSNEVFCTVLPINANEHFRARDEDGITPTKKFRIFGGDYDGEELLEYKGQRLVIYRIYEETNGHIELYCSRKLGRND